MGLKVPIEIPEDALPGGLAVLHGVQLLLHVGGKLHIGDVGELVLHQLRHHPAQVGDVEVFPVLDHILPVQNGGHSGGVGGGTADALLLHGPDQRGVGIVGRGLGEVLILGEVPQIQRLSLPQRREGRFLLLLFLVPALLIHGGVAGEFQAGGGGPEAVSGGDDLHRHTVVNGIGHLAGHKAAPHQPVKPVLLAGQILFHHLRGQIHVAGPDGLMAVLGAGLGLVVVSLCIALAVTAHDELFGGGQGLLAQPQGVCTHIGDQAHGALALDVHALIELLGNGHSPPGRHRELPGRLLLEGRGGEGR